MILSCRFLNNVASANEFDYGGQILEFTQGDALYVYVQLIDQTKDKSADGYNPAGRRYIPATGATLSVKIDHINDARVITRTATQPYSSDLSIWRFQILSTDQIKGTSTVRLTLTEGTKVTTGKIINAIRVQPSSTI